MSEPVCSFCGDGPQSIGTRNHIECVSELVQCLEDAEIAVQRELRDRGAAEQRLMQAEEEIAGMNARYAGLARHMLRCLGLQLDAIASLLDQIKGESDE